MKTTYKVWLHIEQLDDPDTENEKYTDIGMPVELAHVSHMSTAIHFVDLIEGTYAGKANDNIEVYYQPELKDVEWGELLYSFEVYRSEERAKRDFPGKKIITYQGDDIEDPTYVD